MVMVNGWFNAVFFIPIPSLFQLLLLLLYFKKFASNITFSAMRGSKINIAKYMKEEGTGQSVFYTTSSHHHTTSFQSRQDKEVDKDKNCSVVAHFLGQCENI